MTGKVEIRIDVQAPLDSVFEALTRRGALVAWFAENAHVSRDEKRYDFWGRFTPYAPGPNDGRHPVLSWRDGVELIYGWRLRDADTTVAITLDGSESVTKLSLSHDAPDRGSGELSLADFWMLSLENLRRYVRDGSAPIRRDYSSALSKTVELALDIEAAPEQVFGALTDPESLKCWMSATAPEVEPVAGGSYRYWEGQGPVEILEIDDNRKLSCLWSYADAIGVSRAGRKLTYDVTLSDRSPGFRTAVGFDPRPDVRRIHQLLRYRFRPEHDRLVSFGPDVVFENLWDHAGTELGLNY